MAKKPDGGKRPIIIKREEVVEGGHHGGAWKVAYADFVTAMMAFFLLMWLINATTEKQRRGLADYFTPSNALSKANSGSGAPFGGHTPFDAGSMVSDRGAMAVVVGKSTTVVPRDDVPDPQPAQPATLRPRDDADDDPASSPQPGSTDAGAGVGAAETTRPDVRRDASAMRLAAGDRGGKDAAAVTPRAQAEQAARAERASFERVARQIEDAVRSDPSLAPLANQIAIDQTPEGLRIQLLDEEKLPMFATGSATLNDRARMVLLKIAPILATLPESLSLSGHTDSAPYRGGDKSNWELSSERANATRRLLVGAGIPETRMRSVSGNADRDLLLPADPFAAANRRIAIIALRDTHPPRP